MRVWALDRWGAGQVSETRYFVARAPVTEQDPQGQGCTCESLSSSSSAGQLRSNLLFALLALASLSRRRRHVA